MESKYYTPSIEEFRVGFEFEVNDNGKWAKYLFLPFDEIVRLSKGEKYTILAYANIDEVYKDLEKNKIRVKYLGKEDIESFGFRCYDTNERMDEFKLNDSIFLDFYHSDNIIIIHNNRSYEDYDCKFFGKIKNKSEFKIILKQLEII